VGFNERVYTPNPWNVFLKEPGPIKGLEGHILAGHCQEDMLLCIKDNDVALNFWE